MNSTELLLGVLFGGVGVGYLLYGKRQHSFVCTVCGLLLPIVPAVSSGEGATVAFGLALMALPFFLRF